MAKIELNPQSVRDFVAGFVGRLPRDAYKGSYKPQHGDGFSDVAIEAPDGRYRVAGSDWLFDVKDGLCVGAAKAAPPSYGGKNVIGVPNQ